MKNKSECLLQEKRTVYDTKKCRFIFFIVLLFKKKLQDIFFLDQFTEYFSKILKKQPM